MKFSRHTDELYVISDLHLGGLPGGQIFNSKDGLVWLLEHLSKRAAQDPSRVITLLINGDFVDFLAEPNPTYFDPYGACDRLDRILKSEPAFDGILDGLQRFAACSNCRLVVNLGNHDLELALPWVQTHFLNLICEANGAIGANVQIVADGTACLFSMNGRLIYCAHGNEVDPWNVTDHESIRRIGRDLLRGGSTEGWIPNAGTQLVIDVMNTIKRDYPFVDLLKPETEAVIPLLAALEPGLLRHLIAVTRSLKKRTWDSARLQSGFLGDTTLQEGASFDLIGEDVAPVGENSARTNSDEISKSILSDANDQFGQGVAPMDLIDEDFVSDQLGILSPLRSKISGRSFSEQLRLEMQKLEKDISFDLSFEDAQFNSFDEIVGANIDVIVTGHSHLRRAVQRKQASGYYFNTGTWARLMKIDKTILSDAVAFSEFIEAIKKGSLDALDDKKGLVRYYNPVFSAKNIANCVHVQLNRVIKEKSWKLERVAETHFVLN